MEKYRKSIVSPIIRLKFYEYNTVNGNKKQEIVDLGNIPPEFIQSFKHVLNANGLANTLTIELVHMFDLLEDATGDKNNLEFIPVALNRGLDLINFSYGYAFNDGTFDMSDSYEMMVTNLKSTFYLSGVKYILEAVSTKAAESTIDGVGSVGTGNSSELKTAKRSYNWYKDPEKRIPHYSPQNFGNGLIWGIRITDIAEAILKGYDINSSGYSTTVYSPSDVIYPMEYYTGSGINYSDYGYSATSKPLSQDVLESYLTQTATTDFAFLINILDFASCETLGSISGPNYLSFYANYTAVLNDNTKEAIIYPGYRYIYYINTRQTMVDNTYKISDAIQNFSDRSTATLELEKLNPQKTYIIGGSSGWTSQSTDEPTQSDVISFSHSYDAIGSMLSSRAGFDRVGISGYGEIDSNGDVVSDDFISPTNSNIGSGYSNSYGTSAWAQNLKAYQSVAGRLPVEGTLTVMGDTDNLNVLSQVKILVYVKQKLSEVSGIYRILSKTDTISAGGNFTTDYQVVKIASDNGNYVFSEQYDLTTD